MAVTAPPDTLRRKEAAERLGVHPNTLLSWAEKGWFTPVRYPNETRYREDEVEALRRRIFDLE